MAILECRELTKYFDSSRALEMCIRDRDQVAVGRPTAFSLAPREVPTPPMEANSLL